MYGIIMWTIWYRLFSIILYDSYTYSARSWYLNPHLTTFILVEKIIFTGIVLKWKFERNYGSENDQVNFAQGPQKLDFHK